MSGDSHADAPTRFVESAGIRFAYRRFGSGRPLVLLQHFMGNLDNHDPKITDGLAQGREVVLFDNAGVGLSSGSAPDTIAGMARDAASFIDGLGLATVDLFGFSMGGHVAQQIAVDRPTLVRRLVLAGTGPRGGEGMAPMSPDVAQLFDRRDTLGEAMWLPIMFSPSARSQAAGRAYVERITARLRDRDAQVSAETIAAHRAAAAAWRRPEAGGLDYLRSIHHPALVVNGSHDIVVPTVNSYDLWQNLPDAQLVLFPDSNHGSHFQYPDRFLHIVTDFLDH
jgi:pimeloyl-ACP methyl ester carboxylesterase